MKIGLVQMNSQSDKKLNLARAEEMIQDLSGEGVRLIMLPEYFNFIGPEKYWAENAEPLQTSNSLARIQSKAIEHGVYIHCGSIMERDGEKVYNTGVVFNPEGEIVAQYRKIHLFDVEIPGGRKYLESEIITPGNQIVTFTVEDITFGMATCYDLRFPELFRKLVEKGAQVFLLPAAFTTMTGKDHWELLLRARAVENLCWVAAADQFGACPPNHMSYGRSMVIDPWGLVVATARDGVSTVTAEIDLKHMREIRSNFPVLQHIRTDIE